MIKSNCHTHTIFCDGKNTAKQMIDSAIDLGFKSLGFSFHSPLPYENDYAIDAAKVEKYYNQIEMLKQEYAEKIEIFNGIEFDYDSLGLIDISRFDYSIGSVHQILMNDKLYYLDYTAEHLARCVDECFSGSWLDMAKHYYSLILDLANKIDFDIVGHFDLITKFNQNYAQFNEDDAQYQKIAKDCLNELYSIKANLIFEINTGAMFRLGKTSPYPNLQLLKHMKNLGFKVMINSDSHSTNSLDFAFDEARNYCKSAGFTSVQVLLNGGFVEAVI